MTTMYRPVRFVSGFLVFLTVGAIFISLRVGYSYVQNHGILDLSEYARQFQQRLETQKWLAERQRTQTNGTKHVILFAYMRGGSTILSQSFSNNKDVFFWYEPLDAFYSHVLGTKYNTPSQQHLAFNNFTERPVYEWERDLLAEYIHNMYTCRVESLPVEALSHPNTFWGTSFKPWEKQIAKAQLSKYSRHCLKLPGCETSENAFRNHCPQLIHRAHMASNLSWTKLPFAPDTGFTPAKGHEKQFMNHAQCLAKYRKSVQSRLPSLHKDCSAKRIVVSKLLRLHMHTIDKVLWRLPDAYVIYYVRDPRAIAVSRIKANLKAKKSSNIVNETAEICQKMRTDLKSFQLMRTRFPGALRIVRYEDYISDINGTVASMYAHVDENVVPETVYSTLNELTHASKNGGSFSQRRTNATAHLDKWMERVSAEDLIEINNECWDVLTDLGYLVTINKNKLIGL